MESLVVLVDEGEETLYDVDGVLLAHAVADHVGVAVAEDARAEAVLPVVVVGEAPQGGLDAAEDDGYVGVEAAYALGVDDGGVFGAHVVASVGAVGVFLA